LKTPLKGRRLQRGQQSPDGVVRRNSVRQLEPLCEPLVFFGPCSDRQRPVGSGDHRHAGNDDQVTEQMSAIDVDAWVFQGLKLFQQRINILIFLGMAVA